MSSNWMFTCGVGVVVQGLSSSLKQAPDTLEDLKLVLSVIARIRAMSLEAEMKYRYEEYILLSSSLCIYEPILQYYVPEKHPQL